MIIPVTNENRLQALALRPAKGQEGFVESVDKCLTEAARLKIWHPVAIYDGDTLVGFSMYGRFPGLPRSRVWLDRFLIDQAHQSKGYGNAAIPLLIDRLRKEYHCTKIYLSIIPGNDTAARLYQKHGFSFNGKCDRNGERIMVFRVKETQKIAGWFTR